MSIPEIGIGRDVTPTCARCGMQRKLPRNWRQLMREDSLTPPGWDGILRCQASHLPEAGQHLLPALLAAMARGQS